MKTTTPYDSDFNEWCHETAALIRERRWCEIDAEHLAEEIEALANRDRRELDSRLTVLLMNLSLRGPSWKRAVREQRCQIGLMLESSPSLRRVVATTWREVYRHAVDDAIAECPWTPEQVLDSEFYPDAAK
jgi:hypothetical protein